MPYTSDTIIDWPNDRAYTRHRGGIRKDELGDWLRFAVYIWFKHRIRVVKLGSSGRGESWHVFRSWVKNQALSEEYGNEGDGIKNIYWTLLNYIYITSTCNMYTTCILYTAFIIFCHRCCWSAQLRKLASLQFVTHEDCLASVFVHLGHGRLIEVT